MAALGRLTKSATLFVVVRCTSSRASALIRTLYPARYRMRNVTVSGGCTLLCGLSSPACEAGKLFELSSTELRGCRTGCGPGLGRFGARLHESVAHCRMGAANSKRHADRLATAQAGTVRVSTRVCSDVAVRACAFLLIVEKNQITIV